jgi:hypothetical protein
MKNKIIKRINCLRNDWAKAKKSNDFSRCIYLDGAIFHLEKILIDLAKTPPKPTTEADAVQGQDLKCIECGGIIGWCECY